MNLHNINYLDLCIKLLQSESEKEVTQVLQSYGFLKPNGCWRHLGRTMENVSQTIIKNKQPRAACKEEK